MIINSFRNIFFQNWLIIIFYIKLKGSRLSSESAGIYKTRNTSCEKEILKMFAFGFNLNLAIHVMPAFFPLLHILFGHPSPDLWLTPFSLHYVWVTQPPTRSRANFLIGINLWILLAYLSLLQTHFVSKFP